MVKERHPVALAMQAPQQCDVCFAMPSLDGTAAAAAADTKREGELCVAAPGKRPLLPVLTAGPAVCAGCCLALSLPLLAHLRSLLPPPPGLVLSIGSGFGLLEALLTRAPYSLRVVGVEVEPSPNRYLPAANHRVVVGTRFLDPVAAEATAWLFIYPRRVGLLREYVAKYGEATVDKVVLAGPRADWEEHKCCFSGWHVQVRCADEVGGRASEFIAIASKKSG